MSFPSFGTLSGLGFAPPPPGLGGFARLGSLGRLSADTSDPNIVLTGTQLRLTGNIYTILNTVPLISVPQSTLDAIASNLRSKAYRVMNYSSSYSAITFDVEVLALKNNIEGVIGDWTSAVSAAIHSSESFDNPNYGVIFNPRDNTGSQQTNIVPPAPQGSNPADKPPTPGHTHDATKWDDGTPYSTGYYAADKLLNSSFFGGAISGGIVAAAGVAGIVYLLFIKK